MAATLERLDAAPASMRSEVMESLWVLVVAGIPTGVVVAGVGSRLAMLVLRLTSPDTVIGVTSDDGFEIGRFTLSGTYNLLLLGAAVGVIGVAAYRAVKPWLLGPVWFARCTVAAASGAVVGSMLVHSDGIDFRLLKPTWLAVGLFVALPAVFGATIASVVDRVTALGVPQGARGRILPVVLLGAFPLVVVVVGIVAVPLILSVSMRRLLGPATQLSLGFRVAVRGAWLSVALLGLVALAGDVRALT